MFGAPVVLRGQRFQTQGQTGSLRVVILVGLLCVSHVGASRWLLSSTEWGSRFVRVVVVVVVVVRT